MSSVLRWRAFVQSCFRLPPGTGTSGRLLLAASIVIPGLLFAGAVLWDREAALIHARREARTAADALAEHASVVLTTIDSVLARVTDRIGSMNGADIATSASLHEFLLGVLARLPQAESIFVVDQFGRNVVSTRAFPMFAYDVRDRDYFRAAVARSGLYVSVPFESRMVGTTSFTVSRELVIGGEFRGLVAVTVLPQYFSSFYRTVLNGPDGSSAAIIRKDGTILFRYPTVAAAPFVLPPDSAFMTAVAQGGNGGNYEGRSTLDGRFRLAAFRNVEGQPLYVTYTADGSVALKDWRWHVIALAFFAGATALALVATALNALAGANRQAEALRHVVHEATRRHEAETKLNQARRLEAIGRLTGGIAHDFNNLLAVIISSLDLVRKRVHGDGGVERLLASAMQAAQRGAGLTQRLLAYARRQELEPRSIILGRMLEGMKDLLRRSVGPGVHVDYDLPAPAVWAVADLGQLELAILNLVINARDAMPQGGTVHVVVEAGGRKPGDRLVAIKVVDTGTGMDEATCARATEPFFTTKGIGKGTGLGLSMVHGFALQSGGAFELNSKVGRGTTATLYLPQGQEDTAAMGDEPDRAEATGFAGGREPGRLSVLVVDDDALVAMGTAAMLEDMGHDVVDVPSGEKALALLASRTFDVVVTDQSMPGMTGVQLGELIAMRWPDTKVVLASGHADIAGDAAAKLLRITKPFTQGDLQVALARAMGS